MVDARISRWFRSGCTTLVINEPITSCQPSTSTKSSSLNGREIKTGGSINMPMEIVTLATMMSSLPAWTLFDPLPVLETFAVQTVNDDDEESLVSMVEA